MAKEKAWVEQVSETVLKKTVFIWLPFVAFWKIIIRMRGKNK